MKPTLVTGASGFIGWHVARLLGEKGHKVRALVRPSSRLRELDAEPVVGDLRDPASLERAVAGCGLVFHVAADYRLWARDSAELYQSNVEGTRNLLEAARKQGVERVVYTSTVGCIGVPPGGIGDESQPVKLEEMSGAYKRSKFLAEKVALEFAAKRAAGGDCESHGAGGRSRREADAHREDHPGFPEGWHAGVYRYRA